MTSTKRTARKAAPSNTTELVTSAAAPEDFRHASLWIVATRTGRNGPWKFIAAANAEHNARIIFNSFASADAHVALVPSLDSGGSRAVHAYDDVSDEEGEATYVARPAKAIEEWDEGRRVR